MSSGFKRETIPQHVSWKVIKKDTQHQTLISTHMAIHAHMCQHLQTHTHAKKKKRKRTCHQEVLHGTLIHSIKVYKTLLRSLTLQILES